MQTLSFGDELVLRAEKPVAGGDMLARHDGRVVFISGAIPGELARVRVDRFGRGFVHGAVVDVVEPHPDRRDPGRDPACGGRAYAHVRYDRQLSLKRDVIRDAFQRIARMGLPEIVTVSPSPESGYRMRARLHGRAGRIGFVRDGTHDICDPARTEQLMETTLRALSSVETWLEGTSESRLQAIELAESIRGDQRVLHVEADRCPRGVDTAAMESSGITGISWSVSGMRDTHILLGSPYVADPLEAVVAGCDVACAKVPLRRHVRGFFQA